MNAELVGRSIKFLGELLDEDTWLVRTLFYSDLVCVRRVSLVD